MGDKDFTKLDATTHGIGGAIQGGVEPREQDATATELTGYAVVFFPKFTKIGPAAICRSFVTETFSQTADAAKVKFMDRIAAGETWETYEAAGWKVRRVKFSDDGQAD